MTPGERVERIFSETVGSDLTSWEKHEFLPSVKDRAILTAKQEKVLAEIEARVLDGDNSDEGKQ